MAKASMKLPNEFLEKISRLGNKTDEIVPRVLQAGAEVVEAKVRSNLQSAIGSGTAGESRSTGELVDSLGISPAKVDKNGNHDIKVGFREPRKDGSSNAMVANILEHGSSKQPARPFLRPARTATRKPAIEAMTAHLEKELQNV